MLIFMGVTQTDGTRKVTWCDGVECKELDPRFDLRNHSPDGFSWGYGGSGPAQLALAMMAFIAADDQQARDVYQDFKVQVIAGIPQSMGWVLSSWAVNQWLQGHLRGERVEIWPNLLVQNRMAAWTAHG